MSNIDKIMEEPLTLKELENKLQIINTLLPNSEGELRRLRLSEKVQLELRIALFKNPNREDIIVIDAESPRTIEMDTYDIYTLEFKTVKAPRTANEILAERSICNEANLSSCKVSGVMPFKNVY